MRHYPYKIDEREVPASKHAIFFRGLNPDITRDQIERFFEDEIGSNKVVFYKPTRDSVCTAVRFESRDDASRCMKNFEDKQVLNCNVDISWYKDVRAYAEKLERQRGRHGRNSYHKHKSDRRHKRSRSPSRDSRHHRSNSQAVSISSEEDSPKRKHRRNRSNSSSDRDRRSRSTSSSSSSNRSRRSFTNSRNSFKKQGPHTPPQTPPPDQNDDPLSMSYTGPEFITVDVVGVDKNIGLINLNRSTSMNAFCCGLLRELADQLMKFDNDPSVRAILLTGDKEYFVSGFDVSELLSLTMVQFHQDDFPKNWRRITSVTKPLIAVVNGFASGLGFELAMVADIVYASPTAQFGHSDILSGSIPEFGGVEMLAKCVGKSYAMEMLLTGTRISAEEALKRGLISKVIPGDQLLNETITMVEKIVKNPVTNLVLAKKTINHAFDNRLRL